MEVSPGHVLCRPGEAGSGMFVLEEGTVTVELPNGRTLQEGAGAFFGELSLLAEIPRTARVLAASDVRCLALSRQDLRGLLHDEPKLAVAMLPVLARRLAETDFRQ